MSKPLVVSIPHHHGKQEALRRLKEGIDHLKTTYAGKVSVLEDRWVDNVLTYRVAALGQAASGTLAVGDDQVTVTVQLPWLLALVAEKAKGLIQKEGTLLLDKK